MISGSDRALLAEAIMWDYEADWLPPGLEAVDRPDLLMWRRTQGPAAQARWANRISYVRTPIERVELVIDEVFAFFAGRQFTWVVGPSSRPVDLTSRLQARGLVDEGDGDLLTADLPITGLRSAPDIEIVEVENAELARVGLHLAHPTASAAELDALTQERVVYLEHPGHRGGYLVAFVAGEPVANAGYRYSADGRTVYLSGAETVERFRGRGIYQRLVAYRAEAAVRRGCGYAAIRARQDTSLPILEKRGFSNHGHLPILTRPTPS